MAGQDSRPPFGGIELGVNAASTKKANAWAAIECITSAEHQKLYMLKTGNPAARKSVYSDPEVLKVFPMAQLIRDSLDGGAPRPLTQVLRATFRRRCRRNSARPAQSIPTRPRRRPRNSSRPC